MGLDVRLVRQSPAPSDLSDLSDLSDSSDLSNPSSPSDLSNPPDLSDPSDDRLPSPRPRRGEGNPACQMVSFLAMFNDMEQDSRSIPPRKLWPNVLPGIHLTGITQTIHLDVVELQ